MSNKEHGNTTGGKQGTSSSSSKTADEYNSGIGVTVNSIKSAIMAYAHQDRWNNNSAYQMGFNDEAMGLIERLAKGDYGLATTIAKQAIERSGWEKYGAQFSEKQAYVLAKAAYDNKLVGGGIRGAGVFRDNSREAAALEARQRAARHERNERRQERANSYAASQGMRPLAKGERVGKGAIVYDKYGKASTVTGRKGDIFYVKDSNGKVSSVHKSKLYRR